MKKKSVLQQGGKEGGVKFKVSRVEGEYNGKGNSEKERRSSRLTNDDKKC